MPSVLEIKDLYAGIEGKEILKGLNLTIRQGEIHALMGPNGSGKSTLANTLMGHPDYEVTGGEVLFKGQNILDLPPDVRSRLGLFLAFQYPTTISGVTLAHFLRSALNARLPGPTDGSARKKGIPVAEFRKLVMEKMKLLEVDESFATRYLNEGFSGGEKKRAEILQMAVLHPEIAILDETDSGLDIDALKVVSQGINALAGPEMGILLITHYQRILNYIKPDYVHILVDGRIVQSGGPELAQKMETEGYDWIREGIADGSISS
ncbi:MAG: Fe-S cluster assembly ATPase SufC [Chloroflexi bacterium]|nr:Fe-S cluster assembly ATPase SufC [Chloroflexota bacterium]